MVARAEFEEKEYEGAANAELAQGGLVMSSGQVIEEVVGFDAIAAPVARHVIWQLLRVPRPPGVRLLPRHWYAGQQPPANRLPDAPISLVLQYKRPEYLQAPQASQWKYWNRPYFRFTRSESQHRVLRRLDRALGDGAVVRYASPAFWRFADLEAAVLTHEVLQQSGFVRPIQLGPHRTWTYIEPGIMGRANPSGRRVLFESIHQLFEPWESASTSELPALAASPTERLDAHLRSVAVAAGAQEPALRRKVVEWADRVRRRDLLLSDEGIQRLSFIALISSVTYRIGATWHLADRHAPPLR